MHFSCPPRPHPHYFTLEPDPPHRSCSGRPGCPSAGPPAAPLRTCPRLTPSPVRGGTERHRQGGGGGQGSVDQGCIPYILDTCIIVPPSFPFPSLTLPAWRLEPSAGRCRLPVASSPPSEPWCMTRRQTAGLGPPEEEGEAGKRGGRPWHVHSLGIPASLRTSHACIRAIGAKSASHVSTIPPCPSAPPPDPHTPASPHPIPASEPSGPGCCGTCGQAGMHPCGPCP